MSLRRSIEGLGAYPSLLLLVLPTATVEPLKLAAVAVAGNGHWVTGTAMIAACYAFSLLVVERLFVIVKPKLLTIPWFAKLWDGCVWVRRGTLRYVGGWIGPRGDGELHRTTSSSGCTDQPDEPSIHPRSASK
ncbi:hypothetical protein [Bradyrhizobium altum]|uniref:hypothetical protein n=1 Tax=Bradyrhizobium altum TaxID=1571202 RepID=UPI001E38F658|nr:hypothetical protein [Bradyrhizobium altum]